MRDSLVSARSVAVDVPPTAVPVPGLDEIREVTIPSVVDFLKYMLGRFGLRVPDDFRLPGTDFVAEHQADEGGRSERPRGTERPLRQPREHSWGCRSPRPSCAWPCTKSSVSGHT